MTSAARGERRRERGAPSTVEPTSEMSEPQSATRAPSGSTAHDEPIPERGLANDAESLRAFSGLAGLQPRRRRLLRELEAEVRMLRVLVEISRATGRSDR
jgi:hypothetical protein